MDMDMGMEMDMEFIQKTMVTYSKYGIASYNKKVLINNTIANSGMTDTGFHTVTLSRKLHIPWLKITK